MLGKKRSLDNPRQITSSKNNLDIFHPSRSNSLKKSNFVKPKTIKEFSHLYNMERSICISCVKAKNKKYPTNKIIPCIPFQITS